MRSSHSHLIWLGLRRRRDVVKVMLVCHAEHERGQDTAQWTRTIVDETHSKEAMSAKAGPGVERPHHGSHAEGWVQSPAGDRTDGDSHCRDCEADC